MNYFEAYLSVNCRMLTAKAPEFFWADGLTFRSSSGVGIVIAIQERILFLNSKVLKTKKGKVVVFV